MDMYIGTILPWAGTYAPQDWQFCWGQTLQVSQYQALFSIIGAQYGGDGRTTFCLPDLRGRFPIGAGVNQATATTWNPGTKYDSTMQVQLGVNNMPAHTHGISNTVSSSGSGTTMSLSLDIGIPVNTDNPNAAPVNLPANNNCTLAVAKTAAPQNATVNMYTTNAPTANATLKPFNVTKDITVPTPNITVTSNCSNTGGGTAVNVKPPLLCINYIICVNGLYPVRP